MEPKYEIYTKPSLENLPKLANKIKVIRARINKNRYY